MICYQATVPTVQLASKFTAHIGQHEYLARFFARHEVSHAFHTQVSRLLMHTTMLASYATRDLYVLTCKLDYFHYYYYQLYQLGTGGRTQNDLACTRCLLKAIGA